MVNIKQAITRWRQERAVRRTLKGYPDIAQLRANLMGLAAAEKKEDTK